MIKHIDLGGQWQIRCVTQDAVPGGWLDWHPAEVPGTVHTDLMAAGLIPDPFYADNELKVQQVHEVDWLYRRVFSWAGQTLNGKTYLVCQGLDTVAEVRLNGTLIGRSENQFLEYRWEVTPRLQEGENVLEIHFRSPLHSADENRRKYGSLVKGYDKYDERRLYIRKAQYSFGWDWGPALPTSGIWRPIYLEVVSGPRIIDVWTRVLTVSDETASVGVTVELEGMGGGETLAAQLSRNGKVVASRQAAAVDGMSTFEWTVANPDLWWPNGYGEPALYDLDVRLLRDGQELDRRNSRIGLRRIELLLEEGGDNVFCFRVNGVKIFAKGADWIPSDSFLPRVTKAKYKKLLLLAASAHMNMLRVWGGGIYEDDVFYQLCDELGLLVWQDFAFACGVYPEHPEYLDLVEREVRYNICRLRNHTCIALWCGNNECEWIWRMRAGRPVEEMPGYQIFHGLLPKICSELDPTRPYWPSSPWGDPNEPNGVSEGNRHQWEIWSGWRDYSTVDSDASLFVTEFGFQAPADEETLCSAIPAEQRWPQSPLCEFHNKQVEGTERVFRFLARHFRVEIDYPSFIYRAQVNQAEALKRCIEHWRRRWPGTAGTLIWQLNDCWPVSSWALIDSELRPKAAYYYAQRLFAPILLSCRAVTSGVEIWLTNDSLDELRGNVHWEICRFTGEAVGKGGLEVLAGPQTSNRLTQLPVSNLAIFDFPDVYLRSALITDAGAVVARCNHLFVEPKHAKFPQPDIQIEDFTVEGQEGSLRISTSVFLKAVRLVLPGVEFADNFFDMDPGETRRIDFRVGEGAVPDTSGLGLTCVS